MIAVDPFGVLGHLLHYSLVIFLVGSAFLVFLYLWKRDKLGLDEEAKNQMMEND